MSAVPSEIFRAYDIRGIVDETLTEETVYLIGKAIAAEAKSCNEHKIIIARDGRLSGPDYWKVVVMSLILAVCPRHYCILQHINWILARV